MTEEERQELARWFETLAITSLRQIVDTGTDKDAIEMAVLEIAKRQR